MHDVVRFEAGRLICKPIREYLKTEQFRGRKIEVLEGCGIFSRLFTVRGDTNDLSIVRKVIGDYFRRLD
jgi:hypothetical protein